MKPFIVEYKSYYQSADCSILDKIERYSGYLEDHEEKKMNFFLKSPLLSGCENSSTIYDRHSSDNRQMTMFGSNNYLGLSTVPEVREAGIEAIEKYGVGSGGVPLFSGTHILQQKLEQKIAALKGCEDSMVFSSGYAANIGTVTGLIRPNNLIVHDRLNHSSLLDGSALTGAKFVRYLHNSPLSLEKTLEENHETYPDGMIVITDGVFSMDGDVASLPEIIEIAKKYNALVMIDDAHATGVIGHKGAGTKSHYSLTDGVDIVSGTLSKAIGAVGGFVASTKKIINYLRLYARSNMYSTALPPSVCASAIAAIDYMQTSERVEQLKQNYTYVSENLSKLGYSTGKTESAIIPMMIGDEATISLMARDFFENDIFVNAVFHPAVPPKQSRFRISVMATHTKEQLDRFLNVADKLGKKYKII